MQMAVEFSPLHRFKALMPSVLNSSSISSSLLFSGSPFENAVPANKTVETTQFGHTPTGINRPIDMGLPYRTMFSPNPVDTFQRREDRVFGALDPVVSKPDQHSQYRSALPEGTRSLYSQAVHELDVDRLSRRVKAHHIGILEEAADVAGNFTKAMVSASRVYNRTRFEDFAARTQFLFDGQPTQAKYQQLAQMASESVTDQDVVRFSKMYKGVEQWGRDAADAPFGHRHQRMLRRLLEAHLVYNAVHKNQPNSFPDRDRFDLALARSYTTGELTELQENVGKVNPFALAKNELPTAKAVEAFQRRLRDRSERVAKAIETVWPKPDTLQTTPSAFAQVAGDVTRVGRQALDTPKLSTCDLMRLNTRKMAGRAEWYFMHPNATYKQGKKALKGAEVVVEARLLQTIADR